MTPRKLTITIPDDVAESLEPWRDRMNISAVCAAAIREEIRMLESAFQREEEDKYAEVIARLRGPYAEHDFNLGFRDGQKYAERFARVEEFQQYEGLSPYTTGVEPEISLPEEGEEYLKIYVQSEDVLSAESFRRGWVAGMMEVWEQVKDRI